MEKPISLKSAERKAFSLTFEDGLWDIMLGLVVMIFAVAPLLAEPLGDFWSSMIFLPIWAAAAWIVKLLKKKAVEPRVGRVNLGLPRKKRLFRLNIVFLVTLTLTFVSGFLALLEIGAAVQWWVVLNAAAALILFSVAAYVLQQNRFYIYGGLVSLAPIVGEWLWSQYQVSHHGYPVTFGLASAVIILTGIARFILFLRAYQIPEEVQS